MTCSWQVIVSPIFVSPLGMERNFRTCRVYSAWELLHKNGGSEPPAACSLAWPITQPAGEAHTALEPGEITGLTGQYTGKNRTRSYTDTGIL